MSINSITKANSNKEYYSKYYREYIESTKNADMSKLYDFFFRHTYNDTEKIMDLGFGSGRDSLFFKSRGLQVTAIDPTEEFCIRAKELGIEDVRCTSAQELDFNGEFDAIWACASLLHVPSKELKDVFKRCYKALDSAGIMYCSFKYGEFEGYRDGRYYTDLNEESLRQHIKGSGFELIDALVTIDVRPDKEDRWLNVILNKCVT
ncbi:MAG: methyltransferase domain-containing protein [Clostridia bacterium]|nr:methyltransferase domain-containing protein [Clostridia bacterium]